MEERKRGRKERRKEMGGEGKGVWNEERRDKGKKKKETNREGRKGEKEGGRQAGKPGIILSGNNDFLRV